MACRRGGDFEFRILGKDKFECVAEFPYYLDAGTDDFVKFEKSLLRWFRGETYQKAYKNKALNGEVNPFETWEEIKRDYDLSDKYDVVPIENQDF